MSSYDHHMLKYNIYIRMRRDRKGNKDGNYNKENHAPFETVEVVYMSKQSASLGLPV